MGISQYHNTIPFYKGDFQYLENNLKKLETLNDIYDYYDIDLDKETVEIDDKQSKIYSDSYSDNFGKILDMNEATKLNSWLLFSFCYIIRFT